MNRLTVVCLFIALSQALGSVVPEVGDDDTSRIAGGTPAQIERFPYAAQIILRNQLEGSGIIVSRRCVLTSAQCFVKPFDQTPVLSRYTVRVGTRSRNSGGKTYKISRLVVHPQYSTDTRDADVAVVVLSKRLSFNARISAATLVPQNFFVPDNTPVTIVGWGQTDPASTNLASQLQQATVFTVNQTDCESSYREIGHVITGNMFCAGLTDFGGTDACRGDKGGPLIYNGQVAGIISWRFGCAQRQWPGVNVRVANYATWINDTVSRNAASRLRYFNTVIVSLSVISTFFVVRKV